MPKIHTGGPGLRERYTHVVEGYAAEFERNQQLHGERIRCRRGCDDCCHQLFQISELEAAEVSRGVQKLPQKVQLRVRERAAVYLKQRAALPFVGEVIVTVGAVVSVEPVANVSPV